MPKPASSPLPNVLDNSTDAGVTAAGTGAEVSVLLQLLETPDPKAAPSNEQPELPPPQALNINKESPHTVACIQRCERFKTFCIAVLPM